MAGGVRNLDSATMFIRALALLIGLWPALACAQYIDHPRSDQIPADMRGLFVFEPGPRPSTFLYDASGDRRTLSYQRITIYNEPSGCASFAFPNCKSRDWQPTIYSFRTELAARTWYANIFKRGRSICDIWVSPGDRETSQKPFAGADEGLVAECDGRSKLHEGRRGGTFRRRTVFRIGTWVGDIVEDYNNAVTVDPPTLGPQVAALIRQAPAPSTSPTSRPPEAKPIRPQDKKAADKKPPPTWTEEEQAAAAALVASLTALGLSTLAALMLQIRAGLPRTQMLADLLKSLRGQIPPDPFDAWKKKYTSLGWRYSEANGVASFEPVAGARNDQGWIYDPARKDFVPPDGASPSGPATPTAPQEGDSDPVTGKVWSARAREWQFRDYYEQERARAEGIDAGLAAQRRQAAAANAAASRADSAKTAQMAHDIAAQKAAIAESYRLRGQIDSILDKLEERELASGDLTGDRYALIAKMRERAASLALAPDPTASLEKLKQLGRLAVDQGRPGFEITYTYRDALIDTALDTGAMASDVLLTRGAASAGLASYRGTTNALESGQSVPGAIFSGMTSGALNYGGGKAMSAGMEKIAAIPTVSNLIKKASQIEIRLLPGATAKAEAVVAKLPPGAAAREIDSINETLAKAGSRYNARRVDPQIRLDPNDTVYSKAVDALASKNQAYLTAEARAVADAVRADLKMRAVEDALKKIYDKNPALRNSITGLENTGSHAMKGSNYRGLDSDIDFTPMHNGTREGIEAAKLLKDEVNNSLRELTGTKLDMSDLKINIYAENTGVGAFKSEGGLKVKDMLNQTSGSIEEIDGTSIVRRLNGGDPVKIGEGTRWTTGSVAERYSGDPAVLARIARQDAAQLAAFRADCLNKYQEELVHMATPAERLHQAAKLYNLARSMETKTPVQQLLSSDDVLFNLAQNVKTVGAALPPAEQDAMAQRLLDALGRGL